MRCRDLDDPGKIIKVLIQETYFNKEQNEHEKSPAAEDDFNKQEWSHHNKQNGKLLILMFFFLFDLQKKINADLFCKVFDCSGKPWVNGL